MTKRIKELVELLNKASILYYTDGKSMMTDYEYDKLYDELVNLEKETGTILSNSPTQNVEPIIKSSLEKYEHNTPMLSLSKTKDPEELASFLNDQEGLLSWKLDGLTIVLTYEDGKLLRGVTRGNGAIGEVVTDNVKQFINIPLTIPFKGKLIVRGEALIKYSDFYKMNESLEDDQYKNPRNLCSGSVRQLDSKITKSRRVNCVIFSLIDSSHEIPNSKYEVFEWLKSLGFEVVENHLVNKENIISKVLEFKNKIKDSDYPSDGLVLTFNNTKYGLSLGNTAKFPRHSIAFKWADERALTTLKNVDWSTSRTGLINPVAVFDPVELEGTTVTRASLHNVSILKNLELGLGDQISVYKANMIIPQVASNETKSNSLNIPDKCPVCNESSTIVKNNEVEYLYCLNEFCPAKLLKRLSLFVSRNAMNIDGISESILNKLIEEKMISHFADIYHLNKYQEQIINFEGFGKKSYDNMIDSIEKSRKVKLANFIFSLGIKDIGLSRAKLICKKYKNNLEVIKNLSFEDLNNLDGIGEVIAKNWVTEFQNDKFIFEFNKLLEELTFIDTNQSNKNTLEELTIVITGSIENFNNRDELVDYIENHGGKVVKAISNNVNYLINNDINSTSSKNKKAKELGINIISENELLNMSK